MEKQKNKTKYTLEDASLDVLLKEFFGEDECFAELFNFYMFGGKKVLSSGSLSDMNPDVSASIFSKEFQKTIKRARDVLKVSKTGECYRILGIENQKAIHYAMPLRVMLYDALTYLQEMNKITAKRKQENDFASVEEFLSGCKKEDKLHPCYTIVIYFGEKKWDGPRTLEEMMNMEPDDPMKAYFSNYPMHLICINELEEISGNGGDVHQLFTAISEIYKTGGKILPEMLSKVRLIILLITAKVTNTEKEYKKILTDAINNRRETIDMCEAAERAFKKEREEGIEEGMEKGMEKGEKKGEKKGIEKGIKITKMILSGKSDEEIMESMELTGEELEKLKKKLEED